MWTGRSQNGLGREAAYCYLLGSDVASKGPDINQVIKAVP
jgi:hypothetical protein